MIIIATEHDSIYAFDADGNLGTNGGMLWHTNLGMSALCANQNAFGARYCGNCYPDIVPEVGVTGTPVIDPNTGTIYLDVFTREGTPDEFLSSPARDEYHERNGASRQPGRGDWLSAGHRAGTASGA